MPTTRPHTAATAGSRRSLKSGLSRGSSRIDPKANQPQIRAFSGDERPGRRPRTGSTRSTNQSAAPSIMSASIKDQNAPINRPPLNSHLANRPVPTQPGLFSAPGGGVPRPMSAPNPEAAYVPVGSGLRAATSGDHFIGRYDDKASDSLTGIFTELANSLRTLWDQMAIPASEREGFAKKHLESPTEKNIFHIQREIKRLRVDRDTSTAVVRLIEKREEVMDKLIHAVDHFNTSRVSGQKLETIREVALSKLLQVRELTAEVAQAIGRWKKAIGKGFIDPKESPYAFTDVPSDPNQSPFGNAPRSDPTNAAGAGNPSEVHFVWNGVKYLNKMENDLDFFFQSPLVHLVPFEKGAMQQIESGKAAGGGEGDSPLAALNASGTSASHGNNSRSLLDAVFDPLRAQEERKMEAEAGNYAKLTSTSLQDESFLGSSSDHGFGASPPEGRGPLQSASGPVGMKRGLDYGPISALASAGISLSSLSPHGPASSKKPVPERPPSALGSHKRKERRDGRGRGSTRGGLRGRGSRPGSGGQLPPLRSGSAPDSEGSTPRTQAPAAQPEVEPGSPKAEEASGAPALQDATGELEEDAISTLSALSDSGTIGKEVLWDVKASLKGGRSLVASPKAGIDARQFSRALPQRLGEALNMAQSKGATAADPVEEYIGGVSLPAEECLRLGIPIQTTHQEGFAPYRDPKQVARFGAPMGPDGLYQVERHPRWSELGKAATCIQRLWRGYLARCQVIYTRMKVNAATKIQAQFRRLLVLPFIKRRRRYANAVKLIQSTWREYQRQKHFSKTKLKDRAAIKIQKLVRGNWARRELERVAIRQMIIIQSAYMIQRAWRHHKWRRNHSRHHRACMATKLLQRVTRGMLARCRVRFLLSATAPPGSPHAISALSPSEEPPRSHDPPSRREAPSDAPRAPETPPYCLPPTPSALLDTPQSPSHPGADPQGPSPLPPPERAVDAAGGDRPPPPAPQVDGSAEEGGWEPRRAVAPLTSFIAPCEPGRGGQEVGLSRFDSFSVIGDRLEGVASPSRFVAPSEPSRIDSDAPSSLGAEPRDPLNILDLTGHADEPLVLDHTIASSEATPPRKGRGGQMGEDSAAVLIQSLARGHLARKHHPANSYEIWDDTDHGTWT